MRIHGVEHFAALQRLMQTYHIAGGTFIHHDRPDFFFDEIKPSLRDSGKRHGVWLAIHNGASNIDEDAIRCFVLGA